MQNNNLNIRNNAIVLANIAELTLGIINNISGNDVSNTLEGEKITNDSIRAIIFQKIYHDINKG